MFSIVKGKERDQTPRDVTYQQSYTEMAYLKKKVLRKIGKTVNNLYFTKGKLYYMYMY